MVEPISRIRGAVNSAIGFYECVKESNPVVLSHCREVKRPSKGGYIVMHVNIEIIFFCNGNSQLYLYSTQSKSDSLFNTQSRVLQADL